MPTAYISSYIFCVCFSRLRGIMIVAFTLYCYFHHSLSLSRSFFLFLTAVTVLLLMQYNKPNCITFSHRPICVEVCFACTTTDDYCYCCCLWVLCAVVFLLVTIPIFLKRQAIVAFTIFQCRSLPPLLPPHLVSGNTNAHITHLHHL